jgi:hypothetical protein
MRVCFGVWNLVMDNFQKILYEHKFSLVKIFDNHSYKIYSYRNNNLEICNLHLSSDIYDRKAVYYYKKYDGHFDKVEIRNPKHLDKMLTRKEK